MKTSLSLPTFTDILPENVESALDKILDDNRTQLNALLSLKKYSWEELIQPLEDMDVKLHDMWAIVAHLNNVKNNKALQEVYQKCLLKLTEYQSQLSQNVDLYHAYETIKANVENLDQAQQKIIDNTLLDFKLNGVHLSSKEKSQFLKLEKKLAELESQFEQNLLDATDAWKKLIIDEREINGLTEDAKYLAQKEAERSGKPGWMLTLQIPCYIAVMTYAENRSLREEMYHAYVTRASEIGSNNSKFDNSPIMEEILILRQQKANLLGYSNFAELSLVKKMAKKPERVIQFLTEIVQYAKPKAKNEWEELKQFALQQDNIDHLQAWDVAYYSEKLRQKQYNISQEELRPYFPIDLVLKGLFFIAEQLYGIKITKETGVDIWHPDVQFFQVHNENNDRIASFYLDLYARPQKRGGAWMDHCYDRHLNSKKNLQLPVTFLVCNFTPPTNSKPALLTHDEVLTLFHEFGHGLHHMLTTINYVGVSGLNNVAWDAVEFPSQFMENFCWEKQCLDIFAKHYQTGETLPQAMVDRLIASKNYHTGLQTLRQLEFALFDFKLHLIYDAQKETSIQELLNNVRKEVGVIPVPCYNRFQHSFSHIFGGGYAAGYYSYKWAEVLSADAFELFLQQGVLNRQLGEQLQEKFLSQGGAKDALELYIDFRGREPSIDALLVQLGMK
jgi:oligopeptidase A